MSGKTGSWVQGRTVGAIGRWVYGGRRKVATGLAAVLAVGLGLHVVFGHNGLIAYKQKREETRMLDEQLERLRVENERLKDHAARLESDPDAIEHQAREELHYARPGEVIYTMPVVPGDGRRQALPAASASGTDPSTRRQ